MPGKIKVAIAGIGNCSSSLIQGVEYYKDVGEGDEVVPGLMHNVFGGYKVSDIEFVAAFDVDKRKVGKPLNKAILEKPNNTKIFQEVTKWGDVVVQKGPVLDGVAEHMAEYPEDQSFRVDESQKPVDVTQVLKDSGAEILMNYMPVGSQEATEHYAQAALDAGCAFLNCMPVFIVSNAEWEKKFVEKGLPCAGDDIKAQIGATITHRTLAKLFADRGVKINGTYQLNVGGNTDFLNMKRHHRLKFKKISKTEAVQSVLPEPLPDDNIHIGPSDWIPWIKDQKICFCRIEGEKFGNVPVNIEVRLSVEDSPNSAGCTIDGIRALKIALDRGVSGAITSISAWTMKHPKEQYPDPIAREMVEEFIVGKRER
ncbi:MAG: inositol-3-phosphate synthase [Candidatus Diapherotrites archaeon]|uniref:Inositol-3-phosphate synthase n=1 Tax=Candidatus Iainarchaeum sp. TaxID=3101447 RepID=A0A2D6M1D1_9ARCH|nr:inositol-3-phosphate synthase [Candidatus Diapherotrites archaeon]|tara:strand:+ start:943 stop:2049 length:1107 start_codon:yes stop_codon:yes gene_type:complete